MLNPHYPRIKLSKAETMADRRSKKRREFDKKQQEFIETFHPEAKKKGAAIKTVKKAKLVQLTRGEIRDITKAHSNFMAEEKRRGRKVTAKQSADRRRDMENSIIRRRKGGL